MPETKDLYEILHLHPSAHPDVVQAAYRRLALLYHPDKNPSPEATEMMAAVNRAYAVLSEPEQRAEYDWSRAAREVSTNAGPSAASASQTSRPQSSVPQNPTGYFTLGSTKSDVANIHGPPHDVSIDRTIREEVWHYGSDDTIEFDLDTGKIQGWSNIRGNLRIRVIPGSNVTNYDFFMVGDHRDEVARLHGTPPVIVAAQETGREIWMYLGVSEVNHVEFNFFTGRVTDWENNDGTLKGRRSGGGSGARPSSESGRASSSGSFRTSRASNWRTISNEYNNVAIRTTDPIGPDYGLIVRFSDRELELYIDWNTQISYDETTTVSYQIDNGPTWRQSWNVSTSREGTFMPAHDIPETIRALFDADEFTVRVYPFGGNPITASFQVNGFREAVGPVLDAWQRAGSPAPGSSGLGCLPPIGCLLPVSILSAVSVALPAIWFLL